MTEPVYDYSDHVEKPSGDGELSTLSNLAEQLRMIDYEVEEKQRALKLAQEKQKDLAERQIPELMDRIGMQKFSTSDGLEVIVRETIRASLGSGEGKNRALDWLEENGHEAVIKLGVSVPFGRTEAERTAAKALAERLNAEGLPASFDRKVEPSTLSSLIRELLEEGQPVDEELFGVFRQRVAKIK